jgi:hypothetical protein
MMIAQPTAATLTIRDTRAPYIRRVTVSRPRWSVPRKWPLDRGELILLYRSMSSGSEGAIQGARIATMTKQETTNKAIDSLILNRHFIIGHQRLPLLG